MKGNQLISKIFLIIKIFYMLIIKIFYMKKKSTVLAIIVPSLIILLLASCRKESIYTKTGEEEIATSSASSGPITRAYRDSFDSWLNFVPDIAGGWVATNPNSHVWWPGDGDGNVTHMGNASIYFNQYTLRVGTQIVMFHAPVIMFFATELQAYNVPSEVSMVVFDDKGNSVWFSNDPAGLPTTRVSPTKITFTGTMHIAGGTGKFTGATGETTLNGYFNPLDLTECSFWQNGWIAY